MHLKQHDQLQHQLMLVSIFTWRHDPSYTDQTNLPSAQSNTVVEKIVCINTKTRAPVLPTLARPFISAKDPLLPTTKLDP